MSSKQISTGPTLKQFATMLQPDEVEVTSKLGPATISRVRFRQLELPASLTDRAELIRSRVVFEYPNAEVVLGSMFEQCISDQAQVMSDLIGL